MLFVGAWVNADDELLSVGFGFELNRPVAPSIQAREDDQAAMRARSEDFFWRMTSEANKNAVQFYMQRYRLISSKKMQADQACYESQ